VIKIISGWSEKGGSTFAFVRLTNALNEAGYETTFYGPHDWHLDKCKADKLNKFRPSKDDVVIAHFLQLPNKLDVKKTILCCHEKNIFEVAKVKKYWDTAVFLNKKQQMYHSGYYGKYEIIPNLKEVLAKKEKSPEVEKVAGIIGSIDENKQTHTSIQRALSEGYEKVILFGTVNDSPYYNNYVKPLVSEDVIEYGFIGDKQGMYDMVGAVFMSSKSEVASLVKDECETTGTKFFGNDATVHDGESLTNEEIIQKWVKLLEL